VGWKLLIVQTTSHDRAPCVIPEDPELNT